MPSRTLKTTVEDAEPDKVEQLAQDVADEDLEYPEGAPEFTPVLKLPRRRRKDAYDAIGKVAALRRELQGDKPEDDSGDSDEAAKIDPADYGKHYEQVVLIEDYLRIVAADEDVFQAWTLEVSDADLLKTFRVYQRKTQPGEAESSTG